MVTPQILAWKYSLHLPHSYSQPLPASRNFSSGVLLAETNRCGPSCSVYAEQTTSTDGTRLTVGAFSWHEYAGGRHRRFRDNEEFLWACFASVSGRLRLEIGISDSLATLLIFLCFVK